MVHLGLPAMFLVVGLAVFFKAFFTEEWGLASKVVALAWCVGAAIPGAKYLRMPHKIELDESGRITLRGFLRRTRIDAMEIRSIRPGGNQGGMLELTSSRGSLDLLSQFDDFHVFLARLRELNPYVTIEGC